MVLTFLVLLTIRVPFLILSIRRFGDHSLLPSGPVLPRVGATALQWVPIDFGRVRAFCRHRVQDTQVRVAPRCLGASLLRSRSPAESPDNGPTMLTPAR